MWNSAIISRMPPVYADETSATASVAMATVMVMNHFCNLLNRKGFRGSCGIQVTRNGSSSVPVPGYLCSRTSSVTPAWSMTMRQYGRRFGRGFSASAMLSWEGGLRFAGQGSCRRSRSRVRCKEKTTRDNEEVRWEETRQGVRW